jgi:hypothetical protein
MTPKPIRLLLFRALLALAALAGWHGTALAEVQVHFHSFNGSLFGGRYPHAFVVFEGTLDATGERVFENYGFSAKVAGPAVLMGPVTHTIYSEDERYVRSTNRHFTLTVSDATYQRLKQEVIAWRDAPGKYYDLDTRNCIHFVGRIAALAGLTVDFPRDMLRKPKAWLNHITALNPQLGARAIR